MATSRPVGICFANLTFAKFPLPMVLTNRYLPICGSLGSRILLDCNRVDDDDEIGAPVGGAVLLLLLLF